MANERYRVPLLVAFFSLFAMLALTSTASASPITDIPDYVNDSLFGGANLYATQVILTACIMVATGILLGMLSSKHTLPPAGLFIILFCVLGALTAIGWADLTFIVMAAFVAVAMFGKTMVDWIKPAG